MNNVHFSQIKVSGYRGRNFTLKMNPRGEHTVFIMDGNTGKTTTIDLLRWCFKYPQTGAKGWFEHMWAKPAYVLDHRKGGPQTCSIIVQFSAFDESGQEHFYKFSRTTEGKFDPKCGQVGDDISETGINDTLEVDYGKEVFTGDKAHYYLVENFRFDQCADYFCFDGEKARDIMRLASDSGKIELLLDLVNRRTTHPTLDAYREKLNELKERVLAEAKMKISDKTIQQSMVKLHLKNGELAQAKSDVNEVKRKIDINKLAEKTLREQYNDLDQHIKGTQAQNLIQRNKYELEQKNSSKELHERRLSTYKDSAKWICADAVAIINQIEADVREKGKLPEPYREDLIQSCKASGKCEICGRTLDKPSWERIEKLERQVAPHAVQVFLSSDCSIQPSSFDPKADYDIIKGLIEKYEDLNVKIGSIKLSEKDMKTITERDALTPQIEELMKSTASLKADEEALNELIRSVREEIKDLESKNIALAENKIILDGIRESEHIIDAAAEKIKTRATGIISQVISQGVSSILGDRFTARLSHADGLMLGEDSFYSRDTGGNSGRLILSYCFAEAMTIIDPMIVDTPAGNIGSQQGKLADHLAANHGQLILLCLPTEISNFGSRMSSNPIEIKNKES
jgi:hypothetical protein